MIARRDLVMGGAAVAAAALAYRLKPHQKLNLLGHRKMADIVPVSFGAWSSQGESSLVTPATEGKLAARLYNEIVSRIYTETATGEQIMMLIAYGDTQSDLLQLHRPEACYPAVGFHLASAQTVSIPLATNAAIPGRRVLAELENRHERIVYWARVGEFLPATTGDQRKAQLKTAMQGFVPDGALFRFSSLRPDASAFDILDRFIANLVASIAPADRPPLIGTGLARQLTA
jgi:EpsI family protein